MNAPVPLSQIAVAPDTNALPPLISRPYLLVLFGPPFFVDASGRRWLEALWAKDLIEHTHYITHLTLAAPTVYGLPPQNAVALDEVESLRNVRCIELPAPRNILVALWYLPRTCAALWDALRSAELVHAGVAGWPLAESWILIPLLMLRRRLLYINVESAFWRLVPGQKAPVMRQIRAAVSEWLNRWSVEASDISTFTHEGYRRSLLRRHTDRGHVVEASWIDDADVLNDLQMQRVIERRRCHKGPLTLVFAGRLTHEKGLLVLLDAVSAARKNGVDVSLDIFGEGALAAECSTRIAALGVNAHIRLRGTMPYDRSFFKTLSGFDMLVVPSLSDEQPRIVFDAYAQGLPVLASRTEGLVQCVEDNVTGALIPPQDVAALHAAIDKIAREPAQLAYMSSACVARARKLTHQEMHRKRWRLLVENFPALTRPA